MAAGCAESIKKPDKGTGVNSYRDIACHYCVEDLPGADRPGARLQKILDALQSGKPVTRLALELLQRQDLEALHRLATGVLSYDHFRELALAEQSDRVAAVAAAKREREAEARARIAEKRTQEAALQARMKEAIPTSGNTNHTARKMATGCAEPIRHTCKKAVVNYSYRDIACHYCVEDLPGADRPGARLQKILDGLQSGKPVTRLALEFLQRQDLEALHRLATGVLSYDRFRELALAEQSDRVAAVAAAKREREVEARARIAEKRTQEAALQARMKEAQKKAEAERLARERDPKYIAKQKNRALRDRYGIYDYIDEDCFGRLMKILKTVDAGQRLSEKDFVWLSTAAEEYFSDALRAAYHRLEAEFLANEFKQKRDPWLAVNASSHFRKADCSDEAASLLKTIKLGKIKPAKLKSALCTTHGGAMRDLGRWDEGLNLGEQAHMLRPDDYRPCTLLGAIYMEKGEYSLGRSWYTKAEERGAPTDHIDQELRHIFFRANKAKQAEMRTFLLNEDPHRYAWVKSKANNNNRRTRKII